MDTHAIETLLLRHYGDAAPMPPRLKQQLITVITIAQQQQEHRAAKFHTYRLSRRRAVKLVAMSSAGLGLLGAGLELLESTLSGADTTQPAF